MKSSNLKHWALAPLMSTTVDHAGQACVYAHTHTHRERKRERNPSSQLHMLTHLVHIVTCLQMTSNFLLGSAATVPPPWCYHQGVRAHVWLLCLSLVFCPSCFVHIIMAFLSLSGTFSAKLCALGQIAPTQHLHALFGRICCFMAFIVLLTHVQYSHL